LSPEDWVGAALEAIATGGLVAVAVEPVAARLGATKGSFYWHFANRDELVVAALLAWEQRDTIDVIAELEAIPVPAVRLRTLFLRAFGTTAVGSVEAALLADAPSPPGRAGPGTSDAASPGVRSRALGKGATDTFRGTRR